MAAVCLPAALLAAAVAAQGTLPRAPSTARMAALLREIYAGTDWKTDPNKAAERAAYYREGLKRNLDPDTELRARIDLGEHLLVAGDSAAAVDTLEGVRVLAQQKGIRLNEDAAGRLRELLAISYLRMGEQQNCLLNHNAQSCIYPLRGGALHQIARGAEGAIREYGAMLAQNPGGLEARWLLNIAYMALGRHPGGVPPRYLIPDTIVPDEYDIGRFLDVAPAAGVAARTHSGGVVAEDMDGDGYFDLIVSSSGPLDQIRYFHNNRDGTFTDQTIAAGLEGEVGGLNVVHADYNNDGRPDLLVLRGGWWGEQGRYPASLLRNNGPDASGQVTFTDVTEEAGLLSPHPTQTAAWADYDNDGYVDLFLGHESSKEGKHPCQLFHNNRDGTFTDVAPQLGLADLGYVKGVAWGDYNNDGKPDLYVSIKGAPNRLFRNDGPASNLPWKFTDVTRQAGVGEPRESFATWWFDYDNDGWLDLIVAGYYTATADDLAAFHLGLPNHAEVPRLYRNNRDGTFTDVTRAAGMDRVILAMGAGYGDLDNDGWLDCYFGTGTPEYESLMPNRMFRNDHGRRFQDVTVSGGFGQLQKGHAIAFADFNRDGNEDVYEVLGGAFPGDEFFSALLENPGHANHWIGLKLVGTKSNRAAIGARVRVEAGTGTGREVFHQVVQSGTSFGDRPFELHIGLGAAAAAGAVEIRWPAGGSETIRGLAGGRVYTVVEGSGRADAVPLRAFAYPRPGVHHHQ
ncbi:MAG: CRTAC1 family protein [Acidobacteriota bacterium]|nr:CRTAC1 family protein [Acidobacteriota bacterium]